MNKLWKKEIGKYFGNFYEENYDKKISQDFIDSILSTMNYTLIELMKNNYELNIKCLGKFCTKEFKDNNKTIRKIIFKQSRYLSFEHKKFYIGMEYYELELFHPDTDLKIRTFYKNDVLIRYLKKNFSETISDKTIDEIIKLKVDESFENNDFKITRYTN